MIKSKIKKIIAFAMVATTCIVANPISAHAEWKQNSTGWWYQEGDSWATGWKQIDSKWYYFDENGYMKTAQWIQYNSKWYYLNDKGDMAHDQVVDDYVVDHDGVWIDDYKVSPREAEDIMIKNDGNCLNELSKQYAYKLGQIGKQEGLEHYGISERVYGFYIFKDGSDLEMSMIEFVGMETGNVYRVENTSLHPDSVVKRIENNKVVQEYHFK